MAVARDESNACRNSKQNAKRRIYSIPKTYTDNVWWLSRKYLQTEVDEGSFGKFSILMRQDAEVVSTKENINLIIPWVEKQDILDKKRTLKEMLEAEK